MSRPNQPSAIQSLSLSSSSSSSSDSTFNSTSTTNSLNEATKERKYSTSISTLRGHNSAISITETFYIPSNISYSEPEKEGNIIETQLFIPSLLTADENGWIIWWDLNTRRPFGCFQAHLNSPVLSLKQLGISWRSSISDNEDEFLKPSIDPDLFGCIMTHGKDGEIKVWRIIDLIKINEHSYLYNHSVLLQKKFPPNLAIQDDENIDISKTWKLPPLIFQMPVNMLNFSNVDMNSRGLLITPSTQQSERIDIYQIDLKGKKIEDSLKSEEEQDELFQFDGKVKRLFKAVDAMELIESDRLDFHIQHIQDYESGKNRNDFGIVMKVQWINSTSFVVGYESGHVITYKITLDALDSKNSKIKIISLNSNHFPNPILALNYDSIRNKLFTTSANDKLVIDNLQYINNDVALDVTEMDEYVQIHKIKHKGISDISVYHSGSNMGDILGLITWDGYSRFYKLSKDNREFSLLFKLKRSSPAVLLEKLNDSQTVELESRFNNGNEGDTRVRSSSVGFSKLQKSYPLLKKENKLNFINGMSKMIIRRRDEEAFDKQWMFIGFKDGRVGLYNLMI